MKKAKHKKKSDTPKPSPTYTPLTDALNKPLNFVDTEIAEGIERYSLIGALHSAISLKRRKDATPLNRVLCALLVWPLLNVPSLHCFCAELCQFLDGKVSILYDFLGREDINWRGMLFELSRRVYRENEKLGSLSQCAFVVDDTSKARAGRKVEGSSYYFDHSEGCHRKGHQVLHLGLAGEKGFLPVEAQLVMGQKAAVNKPKDKPFKDQRSSAARDMRRASEMTKPQMFRDMLKRALEAGFMATYLLADSWFGCKENIQCALDNNLTAIFQMKRGNMSYNYKGRSYNATELYLKFHRTMKPISHKGLYKTVSITVQLNLQTDKHLKDKWVDVRLVFSAPVENQSAQTWVLFLCTDVKLSDAKILEVYSLRWSIEVYFKEVKQNLGFLKEQSGAYEFAYASVNLAGMRYLLLFDAMLRNGSLTYGQMRDRQTGQLLVMTYASLMWQLFRALIEGALDSLIEDLGKKIVDKVFAAIDLTVEKFLNDALQLTPDHVAIQLKAEELGYL